MLKFKIMVSQDNLCFGANANDSLCEKKIKNGNSFYCKDHISQYNNVFSFGRSVTSWILQHKIVMNANKNENEIFNNKKKLFFKFLIYNKNIIYAHEEVNHFVNFIIKLLDRCLTFEDLESCIIDDVEKNIEPLVILNSDIVEI
jgi:hypothetical protein